MAAQFILDRQVTRTLTEPSAQHLAQTYYHNHVEKPSPQFERQFLFYRSLLMSSYVSQYCSTIFHFSLFQKNIKCYSSLHKQYCSVFNDLTSLICIQIKEPALNAHCSSIIFRLQKRMIRIIVGIRGRDSCREHFKMLKVLPLQSQYIPSLLLFVINNRDYFMVNSEIHNIKPRTKSNLHQPISNLSAYQKGNSILGSRCSIVCLLK
jgi:hypothetical protein